MGNPTVQSDYHFTDIDFREISALARESFGLHLESCKKNLVYSRLSKRLRLLGLDSFEDYREVLRGPVGKEEQREMLSALTTNVTQFFRERHHFDQLRDEVLPKLMEAAQKGAKVRIWSAGCSAGQEPYSIALTVLDFFPEAARYDVKILATDIDPAILKKAVRGRYGNDERKVIPSNQRSAYTADAGGEFVISPSVRKLVSFGELNLVDSWPIRGPFDVIFCRNVAIYFDNETQSKLWKRYADILKPEGYLMIGHSERLHGPATGILRSSGITSYQKVKTLSAKARPGMKK